MMMTTVQMRTKEKNKRINKQVNELIVLGCLAEWLTVNWSSDDDYDEKVRMHAHPQSTHKKRNY